jgi:hypothetical protein
MSFSEKSKSVGHAYGKLLAFLTIKLVLKYKGKISVGITWSKIYFSGKKKT